MKKILFQDHILFPDILWKRPVHLYKRSAGKVLILASSKGMSGAAILTSEAVFKSGTGILLLGFPENLKEIYKNILPEAMTLPLRETKTGSLSTKDLNKIFDQSESCDVVAIGPGLSQNPETTQLIWQLVFKIKKPVVLDADGLNAISLGFKVIKDIKSSKDIIKCFKKRTSPTAITPHPGEALRIIKAIRGKGEWAKITADYIEKNKVEIAPKIADKLDIVVVLKGYETVIAEPEGKIVVNKTGNPGMATAGSGDVLCGIIASFIAQNPKDIFEAACTAVYLHGLAGDIARDKIGERSMIASDITKYLPEAIKKAESSLEEN